MQEALVTKQIGKYSYSQHQKIGHGCSSIVYKGKNIETGTDVAVKVISLQSINSVVGETLLRNEIKLLKCVECENIIKVFDIYKSKNNVYIISEFCEDGDLGHIINKRQLPEIKALEILKQLITGMNALKQQKIVHRDIKPQNILCKQGIYKLADFGFAFINNQQSSHNRAINAGTPLYMAPEILDMNACSIKSDIWSLGVVFYQMIYQLLPFNSLTRKDLQKMQLKGIPHVSKDPRISPKTKQILLGMLQIDPFLRIGLNKIEELLNLDNIIQTTPDIIPICHQQFSYTPLKPKTMPQLSDELLSTKSPNNSSNKDDENDEHSFSGEVQHFD